MNEDDFKHVDLQPFEVETFRLIPGDILACRFNGNLHYVGRFSLYRGEPGRTQVNPDKLIRFRVNSDLHSPRYVCFAMNAASTRETIESMCATTAGNIGLSAGLLKTVKIPLPPLAEQRRIVAKVDHLMALVDGLEAQLVTSRAAAAKLLDALVAELTGTVRRPGAPAPSPAPGAGRASAPGGTEPVAPASTTRRPPARAPAAPDAGGGAGAPGELLLLLLRERGSLSNSEAQAATGLDPATIREHLRTLVAAGQRRGMRYHATVLTPA